MLKYIKVIYADGGILNVKYTRGRIAELKKLNYIPFSTPRGWDIKTMMHQTYFIDEWIKYHPQHFKITYNPLKYGA